jgi:hypothetical protein
MFALVNTRQCPECPFSQNLLVYPRDLLGTVIATGANQEAPVIVDDLDIQPGKISEGVQRIVDAAATTARRRGHGELTTAHLFFGYIQSQWNFFAEVMRDLDADPHGVVLSIE